MKSTLALLIVLTAATAFGAGSEAIIKQRAKDLSNQNNVRQGVPPPTQQAPPGQAAAPAAPAPSQAMTHFQSDLGTLKADAPATADQKQKLAADLMAMAQGTKPSQAAANKLAEDLATAFSTKPLSATSRARLSQELDAVMNPSKYPQAKMQAIFDDVQAIFQENGIDRKLAVAISEDVKALAPH
jgi:hypothetical protein